MPESTRPDRAPKPQPDPPGRSAPAPAAPAGNIFAPPPAVRDSESSRAAARRVAPRASGLRDRVLAAIRAAGVEWLTDEQGAEVIGVGGNTWRPRRVELVRTGLVAHAGRRRPTASGGSAGGVA